MTAKTKYILYFLCLTVLGGSPAFASKPFVIYGTLAKFYFASLSKQGFPLDFGNGGAQTSGELDLSCGHLSKVGGGDGSDNDYSCQFVLASNDTLPTATFAGTEARDLFLSLAQNGFAIDYGNGGARTSGDILTGCGHLSKVGGGEGDDNDFYCQFSIK